MDTADQQYARRFNKKKLLRQQRSVLLANLMDLSEDTGPEPSPTAAKSMTMCALAADKLTEQMKALDIQMKEDLAEAGQTLMELEG